MTIVWVILAVVIALILLWLWAIAPHLPRADFSAFAKYDYAHRGLHDKEKGVPENSLLAFDMACRGGFGMELDLQLTQDGRIVIHHDRNIRRTCGVDRNIDEMTYEELSGYRLLGSQERVPLFSDVLKVVDGRTPLIVEFKSYTRLRPPDRPVVQEAPSPDYPGPADVPEAPGGDVRCRGFFQPADGDQRLH